MSLISEALRKVQKERDIADYQKIPFDKTLTKKKNKILTFPKLAVLSIGAITIVVLIYLTVFMEKKVNTKRSFPIIQSSSALENNIPKEIKKIDNLILKPKKDKTEKTAIASPKKKDVKDIKKDSLIIEVMPEKTENKTDTQKQKPSLKDKALLSFNQKKYGYAIEEYKELLKIKKEEDIYLKLYSCYKKLNNSVLANYYINEGVEAFPDSFYLNKISTVIKIREKKYEQATDHINKALIIRADDYVLYTYLGLCDFHRQKFDKALINFHKSLQLNPNSVENYYYIGLIYDNKQEFLNALDYYKYFIEVNSKNKYFRHKEWIFRRIEILESSLSKR